jgi:hypothetical protein
MDQGRDSSLPNAYSSGLRKKTGLLRTKKAIRMTMLKKSRTRRISLSYLFMITRRTKVTAHGPVTTARNKRTPRTSIPIRS